MSRILKQESNSYEPGL